MAMNTLVMFCIRSQLALKREKMMIGFKFGRAIDEPVETIWFSCFTILCGSKTNDDKFCHLLTSSEFHYQSLEKFSLNQYT